MIPSFIVIGNKQLTIRLDALLEYFYDDRHHEHENKETRTLWWR